MRKLSQQAPPDRRPARHACARARQRKSRSSVVSRSRGRIHRLQRRFDARTASPSSIQRPLQRGGQSSEPASARSAAPSKTTRGIQHRALGPIRPSADKARATSARIRSAPAWRGGARPGRLFAGLRVQLVQLCDSVTQESSSAGGSGRFPPRPARRDPRAGRPMRRAALPGRPRQRHPAADGGRAGSAGRGRHALAMQFHQRFRQATQHLARGAAVVDPAGLAARRRH